MGRIILALLTSLLVFCSLSTQAQAGSAIDLLLRISPPPHGTIKMNPSLCWILRNKPPVGATRMFTLMDLRSKKPVLELQLPPSVHTEKNETSECVNLKDYDIQLEPDIQYRWYIWIARNPESRSRDVVVAGRIERCSEDSCPIGKMPSQCDRNSVRLLATRGFYYDAISCLCDLIKSNPDDKNSRRMLDAVMRQAGLETQPELNQ